MTRCRGADFPMPSGVDDATRASHSDTVAQWLDRQREAKAATNYAEYGTCITMQLWFRASLFCFLIFYPAFCTSCTLS
jgi:hypothetical protein